MLTDRELSRHVEEYLRACFRAHTAPQVTELAKQLGVSRFTLNKQFRQQHGISLGAYLKQQQIAYAMELLRTTELSIANVAKAAAFGRRRSFHRAFKRATGMTPAAYRRISRRIPSE